MSRIFTAWKVRYFDREKQRSKNSLDIFGERGCGKTAAAQAYVRAHKNKARYFLFADLDGAAALTAFAATFQLENNNDPPAKPGAVCQKTTQTPPFLVK